MNQIVVLTTIDKSASRAGSRWSAQEIKALLDHHTTGTNLEDIAAELNRSVRAVKDKTLSLGLKKGTPGPRAKRVNYWMAGEEDTLREEWRNGTSVEEIASILGRSRNAVLCKKDKLKLPSRLMRSVDIAQIRELYNAGIPCGKIAKQFGVSRRYVEDHCRVRPLKLSDEEIEIIEDKYREGCTCRCIARRIRRHTTTVHKHIKQNGLEDEPQDLDELVEELQAHGLTPGQIAIKLELPRRSINSAIKRNRRKGHA